VLSVTCKPFMLSVVKLNVVMLSVVAPFIHLIGVQYLFTLSVAPSTLFESVIKCSVPFHDWCETGNTN
jgi:hypothetical protein